MDNELHIGLNHKVDTVYSIFHGDEVVQLTVRSIVGPDLYISMCPIRAKRLAQDILREAKEIAGEEGVDRPDWLRNGDTEES